MSDPQIEIEPTRVTVEPGGQASVTLTVHNPGTIVENYALDVVGAGPDGWAQVLPPELSVFPQQQATAVVVFAPPAGSQAPGGSFPFGVRVRSTVDSDATAVVEGDLEVGQVFGLQAKLVPVSSTGRWRGRHTVQITNYGNAAARLRLTSTDPDEALGHLVRPEEIDVPLGGQVLARVWVRTRKPFLRGSPVRIPFQVRCDPVGAEPAVGPMAMISSPERPIVDGALTQKPIVSRAALMVTGLVVAGLVAGGVYLYRHPAVAARSLDPLSAPLAPTDFEVKPAKGAVRLSWGPLLNVDGYAYQEVTSDKEHAFMNEGELPSDNSTKELAVEDLKQHCYQIRAVREVSGKGLLTAVRCAAPLAAAPAGAPTGTGASQPGKTGGGTTTSAPTSPTTTTTPPPSSPGSSSSPDVTDSGDLDEAKWYAGRLVDVGGNADANAEAVVSEIAADGLTPAAVPLLYGQTYPDLWDRLALDDNSQSALVVIGPFDDEASASAACSRIDDAMSQIDLAGTRACAALQAGKK